MKRIALFSFLCSLLVLTSQSHADNYLNQANSWNAVFQQTYISGNTSIRWTGGDGALSLDLPYCSTCASTEKYRKLWLFGDSDFGSISSANIRDPLYYQFGNTIAITTHGSSNSTLPTGAPMFDWGAQALQSTSSNSWMPLLLDTSTLSDLHPLRIATRGYTNSGFANQGSIARVYRTPWNGLTRNNNLIPIYEHYNPWSTFDEYKTTKVTNGAFGLIYERIAFWVFQTQQTGTVPLYRYYSPDVTDVLLSTYDNLTGIFGYQDRTLLGYVYPANATTTDTTYPLIQYFKAYAVGEVQHKYTTRPNDSGYPAILWPNRGVVIGNDLVYLFGPVLFNGSGLWDWENVEKGLVAIVRNVNLPYSQWGKTAQGNWTTAPSQYALEPSNASIHWGIFLLKDPDFATNHYVYVYGLRDIRDEQTDPLRFNDVVLARVTCNTADDFVNYSNWVYYSSGSWVSDQQLATAIASDVSADFSIVKNPNNNHWLLVHGGTFLEPTIKFFHATSLTGPFTASASFDLTTYVNESSAYQNYFYYAQSVHGNLSYGGDASGLMISYVRSSSNSADSTNPSVYVPRFVNLPWSTVDP